MEINYSFFFFFVFCYDVEAEGCKWYHLLHIDNFFEDVYKRVSHQYVIPALFILFLFYFKKCLIDHYPSY